MDDLDQWQAKHHLPGFLHLFWLKTPHPKNIHHLQIFINHIVTMIQIVIFIFPTGNKHLNKYNIIFVLPWHFQFQSHCFYFGPRNSWLLHFLCVPHAASGGRGLADAARGGCGNVTSPVGGRMLVLMTDVSPSPNCTTRSFRWKVAMSDST